MRTIPKALCWCQETNPACSCFWNRAWGWSSGRTTNWSLSLFWEDQLYIPPHSSSVQMTPDVTTFMVHFRTLCFPVNYNNPQSQEHDAASRDTEVCTRKNILQNCLLEWALNWLQFLTRKKNTEGNQIYYVFNAVQDLTVKIKLCKRRGCVEKDMLKHFIEVHVCFTFYDTK